MDYGKRKLATAGQWVDAQVHTPSAAASSATAIVTVGGQANNFTAITASGDPYTSVSNNGSTTNTGGRLYKTTLGTVTFVKGLFAIRLKQNSLPNQSILFGDNATGSTSFKLYSPSGILGRLSVAGGTSIVDIAGAYPTTGIKTLLISIDLSLNNYESYASAVKATIDNSIVTLTSTAWASPTQMALANNSFGILDRGSATVSATADATIEFFWGDWGDANYTLPDIYDPEVFANFYQELIGTNGENITGSAPKMFFKGDAAYWNAPTNLGTLGAFTMTGNAFT